MAENRNTNSPCNYCRKHKYCTKQCKKLRDYIYLETFRIIDKKTGISKIMNFTEKNR